MFIIHLFLFASLFSQNVSDVIEFKINNNILLDEYKVENPKLFFEKYN